MSVQDTTAGGDDTKPQGDVFESLSEGDKILWDGKKQPLTVKAGYKDTDADFAPPIMIEGPQGGDKMLIQNKENPDSIAVGSMTASSNNTWISGLRIVG